MWQWLRHGVTLDDDGGQPLTLDRVNLAIQEELDALRAQVGAVGAVRPCVGRRGVFGRVCGVWCGWWCQSGASPPQAYPCPCPRPWPLAPHARCTATATAARPAQVGNARYATGRYLEAGHLFKLMVNSAQLPDFLTLPALDILIATEWGPGVGTGAARSKL